MKTLGEWVREKTLTRDQAVGWLVRLAKGLLVLHELDVAYGRITRHCVRTESPDPRSSALLVDSDEVERDFHFYSLDRIERAGSSKDDDVWALGVLFYHLLTGGYPFPGEKRVKVGERIKWAPPVPIDVYGADAPDAQRLLDRVFKADEGQRLASLPLLIDALVLLDRKSDALPPLELGVAVAAPDAPPPAEAEGEPREIAKSIPFDLTALKAKPEPKASKSAGSKKTKRAPKAREESTAREVEREAPSTSRPTPTAPSAEPLIFEDEPTVAVEQSEVEDEPTIVTEESQEFPFPDLPESRTKEVVEDLELARPRANDKPPAVPFVDPRSHAKESAVDWTKAPAKETSKPSWSWVWIVIGAVVGGGVVAYLLNM